MLSSSFLVAVSCALCFPFPALHTVLGAGVRLLHATWPCLHGDRVGTLEGAISAGNLLSCWLRALRGAAASPTLPFLIPGLSLFAGSRGYRDERENTQDLGADLYGEGTLGCRDLGLLQHPNRVFVIVAWS